MKEEIIKLINIYIERLNDIDNNPFYTDEEDKIIRGVYKIIIQELKEIIKEE